MHSASDDDTWSAQLTAVRLYAAGHDGHLPTTRDPDPQVAALGSWWVAQNIGLNRRRMTAGQLEALDDLEAFVAGRRALAHEQRISVSARDLRVRARAAAASAGVAAAEAARQALDNPHLLPGDRRILQLRIDNPELTIAEVAGLAGMRPGQFAGIFRGALRRTANSSSPLARPFPDRLLDPSQVAEHLGVELVTVGRWARAGLLVAEGRYRGSRRYRGSEVMRVQGLLAGGWPAEFTAAATPGRRSRRALAVTQSG